MSNKSTVYLLKMLKNSSFLFITYEVRTNLGHSVGTSDNFFKVLHASLDYKTVDMSKRASFKIFCSGKYQKEVNKKYFFGTDNIISGFVSWLQKILWTYCGEEISKFWFW